MTRYEKLVVSLMEKVLIVRAGIVNGMETKYMLDPHKFKKNSVLKFDGEFTDPRVHGGSNVNLWKKHAEEKRREQMQRNSGWTSYGGSADTFGPPQIKKEDKETQKVIKENESLFNDFREAFDTEIERDDSSRKNNNIGSFEDDMELTQEQKEREDRFYRDLRRKENANTFGPRLQGETGEKMEKGNVMEQWNEEKEKKKRKIMGDKWGDQIWEGSFQNGIDDNNDGEEGVDVNGDGKRVYEGRGVTGLFRKGLYVSDAKRKREERMDDDENDDDGYANVIDEEVRLNNVAMKKSTKRDDEEEVGRNYQELHGFDSFRYYKDGRKLRRLQKLQRKREFLEGRSKLKMRNGSTANVLSVKVEGKKGYGQKWMNRKKVYGQKPFGAFKPMRNNKWQRGSRSTSSHKSESYGAANHGSFRESRSKTNNKWNGGFRKTASHKSNTYGTTNHGSFTTSYPTTNNKWHRGSRSASGHKSESYGSTNNGTFGAFRSRKSNKWHRGSR